MRGGSAAGSQNWIDVHNYHKTADAIKALKAQGMQVLVTNLSDTAVNFTEIDYTKPTAIILGQEKFGTSKEKSTSNFSSYSLRWRSFIIS